MHGGGGSGGGGGGGGGVRLAPPSVAGATLKLQEGRGFTAVVVSSQPPPLCAQGLPSSAQLRLREGRGARGGDEGGERKRVWRKKTTINNGSASGNSGDIKGLMSAEQGRSGTATVELVADALKKEFAVKLARRDDILQVLYVQQQIYEVGVKSVNVLTVWLRNLIAGQGPPPLLQREGKRAFLFNTTIYLLC